MCLHANQHAACQYIQTHTRTSMQEAARLGKWNMFWDPRSQGQDDFPDKEPCHFADVVAIGMPSIDPNENIQKRREVYTYTHTHTHTLLLQSHTQTHVCALTWITHTHTLTFPLSPSHSLSVAHTHTRLLTIGTPINELLVIFKGEVSLENSDGVMMTQLGDNHVVGLLEFFCGAGT